MKLSEIKGERVFDVIAELIEPIATIAQDNEVSSLFKREKVPKGMTAREFAVEKIKDCMPKLVKNHKDELCAILGAIEGMSKEEYAENVTMMRLMKDIIELLNDDEFTAFFG